MLKKKTFAVIFLAVFITLVCSIPVYAADFDSGRYPEGVKAASYNYSKIKVSWDKVEGADGYQVYRASSRDGKYKRVYSTDDPEKNWYINTNRKAGQIFWYKVRAYSDDGKVQYTKFSKPVSAYAKPNKVKKNSISCSGYIYRNFNLKWKKVTGADGYQVYMKERNAEKFTFMGNYKEAFATLELPDTTKEYDLKVRAYVKNDGKKIKGPFSEVFSYTFDWSEADLVEAGTEYIVSQWADATFDSTLSNGETKTPYNGTSWLAVWPKRFCLYEPWDEVKAEFFSAIDTDVKMQQTAPQDVSIYITPDNDKNWVTVYLLS